MLSDNEYKASKAIIVIIIIIIVKFDRWSFGLKDCFASVAREKEGPFSMAMGNVQLIHECSPEHLLMEAARLKWDKETREKVEWKSKGV